MKKSVSHKIVISLLAITFLSSCKELFNEPNIQSNPNAVTDVDVATLLSGTLVGVALLHEDTDVRISAIWAGALNGLADSTRVMPTTLFRPRISPGTPFIQ